MTLRIDPVLHDRLRKVAQAEGRSVSAQVLVAVRKDLEAKEPGPLRVLPTFGWLSDLGPPPDLSEFRRVRRMLSRGLERRARKRRKPT